MTQQGAHPAMPAIATWTFVAIMLAPTLAPLAVGLPYLLGHSGGLRIDWAATLVHCAIVTVLAVALGAWIALDVRFRLPAWRLVTLWFVLAAMLPASLLAECLSLVLRLGGGHGREMLLTLGHVLMFTPFVFVVMYRRAMSDDDAYYLLLRNFGDTAPAALAHLLSWRYRDALIISGILIFCVCANESAMTGVLGGRTAYLGATLHTLALGSADPGAFASSALVQTVPPVLFFLAFILRRVLP
jgi:ABC-type spermidine/putrescine transport system permease subunit II